jgi:hypothetical protein
MHNWNPWKNSGIRISMRTWLARTHGICMRRMDVHVLCAVPRQLTFRRAAARMDAHVACAMPHQLASLRAAAHATQWEGCAPERSASAHVQVNGGAVVMIKGELVFDGVAISDTSATARRPRTRTPVGPSAVCRGGPAPDRCRVQDQGGAIAMVDGAVTFRGSSTITHTRAVRLALTHARARARMYSDWW